MWRTNGTVPRRQLHGSRATQILSLLLLCLSICVIEGPLAVAGRALTSSNISAPEQTQICLYEVVNPTCGNGTQLATDYVFPCLTESFCNATLTDNSTVGCMNWICSLRLNCGCFAGGLTSCAANRTQCNKQGCQGVVDMFEESGCIFSDFLGPRNESEWYTVYLDQCLLGCPPNHATTGLSKSIWIQPILFSLIYLLAI